MNRRQLIKATSLLLGCNISPALLADMKDHVQAHHRRKTAKPSPLRFLGTDEAKLLAVVIDIIIPRTDTPGARDVGVLPFIDLMLSDWYDDSDSWGFMQGLSQFSLMIRKRHNKGFCDLSAQTQNKAIERLDRESIGEKAESDSLHRFYRMTKELTLIGYYTSAEGMSAEIHYRGPMGEYDFTDSGPPGSVTRY